jgi:hypothetical protein
VVTPAIPAPRPITSNRTRGRRTPSRREHHRPPETSQNNQTGAQQTIAPDSQKTAQIEYRKTAGTDDCHHTSPLVQHMGDLIADSGRLASRLFVLARARRSLSYGGGHLRSASKVRASAGRSRAATGRPATCVAAAEGRLARWACLFTGTLGADPWPGRHPTVHTRWNLPAWCSGTPAPPRVQMPGDRGLAERCATG